MRVRQAGLRERLDPGSHWQEGEDWIPSSMVTTRHPTADSAHLDLRTPLSPAADVKDPRVNEHFAEASVPFERMLLPPNT